MREAARSRGCMPPSPVVVEMPTALAARPSASLAFADSAPNDMPEIAIGVSSTTGSGARLPSTVRVSQRSR